MLSILFFLTAQTTQYLILWPTTASEITSAAILTTWAALIAVKVEDEARWGRQDLRDSHHTSLFRWLAMACEVIAWALMIFAPTIMVGVIR